MRTHISRSLRSLPILLALGCGGGSDGGPAATPAIVFSDAALDLVEGRADTVTVTLDEAPGAMVTVNLSSAGKVTFAPTSLSFSPADFSTPKSVILTPVQDLDLAAGTDTVTATAAGLVTIKIPVAIAEDDSQATVLDSTSLAIVEGDSASFGVKLAYQPNGTVNVTLAPSDTMVVLTTTTLQFTPADYSTSKSVWARARQDADLVGDSLHITLSVPGGSGGSLPVSITDDDSQSILVDSTSVSVTEGDSTTVGVRLAFQPAATTTVSVASLNDAVAVPGVTTLEFTPADFATPKAVRVIAPQDNDLAAGATTVRFSSTGLADQDVTVQVADNDTQAFVTSVDTVFVTEGLSTTLQITLAFQPAASVVATLTIDGVVATSSVSVINSFTAANYTTGFTVGITGTEDANTVTDGTFLTIQAAGVPTKSILVIVADND